mgnify:FL=1
MNRDASNNSDPEHAKGVTVLFYFDLIIICKSPLPCLKLQSIFQCSNPNHRALFGALNFPSIPVSGQCTPPAKCMNHPSNHMSMDSCFSITAALQMQTTKIYNNEADRSRSPSSELSHHNKFNRWSVRYIQLMSLFVYILLSNK